MFCEEDVVMRMTSSRTVWQFKLLEILSGRSSCDSVTGEYMGHEGRPYCERCYHEKYGVKCAYCLRFISGKVPLSLVILRSLPQSK